MQWWRKAKVRYAGGIGRLKDELSLASFVHWFLCSPSHLNPDQDIYILTQSFNRTLIGPEEASVLAILVRERGSSKPRLLG